MIEHDLGQYELGRNMQDTALDDEWRRHYNIYNYPF
jgi:hypothetical protein